MNRKIAVMVAVIHYIVWVGMALSAFLSIFFKVFVLVPIVAFALILVLVMPLLVLRHWLYRCPSCGHKVMTKSKWISYYDWPPKRCGVCNASLLN